jgi:hypothetical protein
MASLPISTFTYLGGIYIFPPWVLFGNSYTLKAKKKLTARINCFHLWSIIFQSGNLYVGQNFQLNRRSGRDDRELPPITVWRQFPALLSAPAVEPRVLSHNTSKQSFQIRHLYWILTGPSFAVWN